ncbi:hypothetical protein PRO82_000279 [Candidatus Protochlamydia amoebophila]|nr:hypothetical protein [Candidatus Protochlamydia amoebophila]
MEVFCHLNFILLIHYQKDKSKIQVNNLNFGFLGSL